MTGELVVPVFDVDILSECSNLLKRAFQIKESRKSCSMAYTEDNHVDEYSDSYSEDYSDDVYTDHVDVNAE